jgi:hypothetical protein
MIEREPDDLIFDVKQRRTAVDKPPVLLPGIGASVESGIGVGMYLYLGWDRGRRLSVGVSMIRDEAAFCVMFTNA